MSVCASLFQTCLMCTLLTYFEVHSMVIIFFMVDLLCERFWASCFQVIILDWRITFQCLKLGVRPAPEAHISDDGRTIFGSVHPLCAHFP